MYFVCRRFFCGQERINFKGDPYRESKLVFLMQLFISFFDKMRVAEEKTSIKSS